MMVGSRQPIASYICHCVRRATRRTRFLDNNEMAPDRLTDQLPDHLTDPLLVRVRAALTAIAPPGDGPDIVAGGRIGGLAASADGVVRFILEAGDMARTDAEALLEAAKTAVSAVDGVVKVSAAATAHSPQGPTRAAGGHDNPLGVRKPRTQRPGALSPKNPKQARIEAGDILPGVKNIIAVASGKGGVGKSTIAANLAVAFAQSGYATGLMDADIYGPSAPTLFGLKGKPAFQDGVLQPVEAHGVKMMSIGLLVEEEQALAWRGPMVMGAVRQLMNDVAWGPLDVMVIDTPPGTGDVHLTLAQTKRLSGAVIVSTPQELALADVRRGVALFRKVATPIIGIIENMAWFETAAGDRQYIFGQGGAERIAAELGVPFLGALPIYPELREASDAGAPLVISAPTSPGAAAFADFAAKIAGSFSD